MVETGEYTRDLCEYLQRLADEVGQSPTVAELQRRNGYPSLRQFLNEFGTWNAAKEAAGLKTYHKEGQGDPFSDEELLAILREHAAATDGPVTAKEFDDDPNTPSAVTYQRRFGSWNNAKERAGLPTMPEDETPSTYTEAELLEGLRRLDQRTDGPVTGADIDQADDLASLSTYEYRFGSLNGAKQEAGITTLDRGAGQRGPSFSESDLLEALHRCADTLGKPVRSLTKGDVDSFDGCPSATTYQRWFGSWSNAKKRAQATETTA